MAKWGVASATRTKLPRPSLWWSPDNCTHKCVGGAGSLVFSMSFVPLMLDK